MFQDLLLLPDTDELFSMIPDDLSPEEAKLILSYLVSPQKGKGLADIFDRWPPELLDQLEDLRLTWQDYMGSEGVFDPNEALDINELIKSADLRSLAEGINLDYSFGENLPPSAKPGDITVGGLSDRSIEKLLGKAGTEKKPPKPKRDSFEKARDDFFAPEAPPKDIFDVKVGDVIERPPFEDGSVKIGGISDDVFQQLLRDSDAANARVRSPIPEYPIDYGHLGNVFSRQSDQGSIDPKIQEAMGSVWELEELLKEAGVEWKHKAIRNKFRQYLLGHTTADTLPTDIFSASHPARKRIDELRNRLKTLFGSKGGA